jgi:ribonuclease HI
MARPKFYVVWKGRRRGLFTSWAECEKLVKGFVGAQYKAFDSREEAEFAFKAGYDEVKGRPASLGKWKLASAKPRLPALCVDAACSGSPGRLEYRGVELEDGRQLFHAGPFANGTNNVGEFLAIVHALTWRAKHQHHMPVYSDSETAIAWVMTGQCRTRLKKVKSNALLFTLIRSAENWLAENELEDDSLLKWDTDMWGDIPADFGRK